MDYCACKWPPVSSCLRAASGATFYRWRTGWWTNTPGQCWGVFYTFIQMVPVRTSARCPQRWPSHSHVLQQLPSFSVFTFLSLTMLARVICQKKDLYPIPFLRTWETTKLGNPDSGNIMASFIHTFIIFIILYENSDVSCMRTEISICLIPWSISGI